MWEPTGGHRDSIAPVLDTARVVVEPVGNGLVAIVDTRSAHGQIVVADWIQPGDVYDAALHALSHLDDARFYGEALAVCEVAVCSAALRWIGAPLVETIAAGL